MTDVTLMQGERQREAGQFQVGKGADSFTVLCRLGEKRHTGIAGGVILAREFSPDIALVDHPE